MRALWATFKLYAEHPLFLLLSGLLVLLMLAVRYFWFHKMYLLLDDTMTLWLMAWMSQAFLLGILIKRQAVSPMMSITPYYRKMAVAAALILIATVSIATFLWLRSMPGWIKPDHALTVLSLLCVLTYLVTVILAYISVRFLVLAGYLILIGVAAQMFGILEIIVFGQPVLFSWLIITVIFLVVTLVWRLAVLKEGAAEFPYLITWPLHRSLEGIARNSLSPYQPATVQPFQSISGNFRRAVHWSSVESGDLPAVAGVLVAAVIIFEIYVAINGAQGFYTRPYSNFLLLTMVPIFITLVMNYRMMAYRDYALMRPVRREDLVQQWGLLLMAYLGAAWFLVSALFFLVPGWILGFALMGSAKIWLFLLFAGVFSQMALAWIAFAATVKNPRAVIVHSGAFISLVVIEFWTIPFFDVPTLLAHTLFAAIAWRVLGTIAYRQWCREEVAGA